jgi:TIR domain
MQLEVPIMTGPGTPTSPASIEVFYSYAHEDEELVKELRKHLSILKRQGMIREWYDREITAGTDWKGQLDQHLNSAGVILLLVSADFLASDYCYDVEMTRALERHDQGEARVIPVLLRMVDGWQLTPFGKLQSLPADGKPVTRKSVMGHSPMSPKASGKPSASSRFCSRSHRLGRPANPRSCPFRLRKGHPPWTERPWCEP